MSLRSTFRAAASSLGLVLAAVSSAQTVPETASPASLLGVRYLEGGVGLLDVDRSDRNIYGLGAAINLPVEEHFDLKAGYGYSWLENNGGAYQHAVGANLVGYLTENEFRPFAQAGLGLVWQGGDDGDDFAVWNVGGGLEYAINALTAVRVRVGHEDSFESGMDSNVSIGAGVSHWFTDALAGTASLTRIEGGDVAYSVGVVFRF